MLDPQVAVVVNILGYLRVPFFSKRQFSSGHIVLRVRPSEIQSQRKLNLPAGTQTHVANHCLPEQTKSSDCRGLRISLTRLNHVAGAHRVDSAGLSDRRECQIQTRARNIEVSVIEDIENLGPEFKIRRL